MLMGFPFQDMNYRPDFHTFKRRWGGDPRFEAMDRKERELLFNEKYVLYKTVP